MNEIPNFFVAATARVAFAGPTVKTGFDDVTESITRLVAASAFVTVTLSAFVESLKTFPKL